MYVKTIAAMLAATFAMTSMDTAAFAGKKRFFANGGNGGSGNLVIGNGNRVGNGGNGGSIRNGGGVLGAILGGGKARANGGDGGSFNFGRGNNQVGNGGKGGKITY